METSELSMAPAQRRRRIFTGEFKAQVVLESVSGRRPVRELAAKYALHPNQIKNWRSQMRKRLSTLFADRRVHRRK